MPENVNVDVLLRTAALLSLERICYVWVWRAPGAFRRLCAGPLALTSEPTVALRTLFLGFKALQIGVVVWWCLAHGGGALRPHDVPAWAAVLGAALVALGQALNVGVFYRLGSTGVFYGNRFGYQIEWCQGFPFSVVAHPQYVGTVLTIWGAFLILRFPHDDWPILPVLETAYYVLGARLEQSAGGALQAVATADGSREVTARSA